MREGQRGGAARRGSVEGLGVVALDSTWALPVLTPPGQQLQMSFLQKSPGEWRKTDEAKE